MNDKLRDFEGKDILDRLVVLYLNQREMRNQILESQDNIAHTVDSVLGHIQTLMKKLDNPVVINSPINVRSEDKNVASDINKVLYDIANRVEKRREPKVDKLDLVIKKLDKLIELLSPVTSQNEIDIVVEEKNIGLPLDNPTRKVYKKNLKTNEYIKVGYVDNDYNLEFYGYSERTKAFIPDLYDFNWYVMEANMSADGTLYPIYSPIPLSKPIKEFGRTVGVLGFKDKYGRDVYYDYFI